MGAKLSLSEHIEQKSIEDFVEYESYITRQLDAVDNSNIPFMKCKINKDKESGLEKITYYQSEFNTFNGFLQAMGKNPKSRQPTDESESKWRQLNFYDDSLTQVFMNKYKDGYFYPQLVKFNGNVHYSLSSVVHGNSGTNNTEEIEFCNNIFNNKYNEHYTDAFIKQTLGSEYSSNINNHYINSIYEYCKTGTSVCGLNNVIFYIERIEHTIAMVFWSQDKQLHCGIYDPMYYERENVNYTKPIAAACIIIQILCKHNSIPLTIYNLSKLFCVKNEKGYHCIQYAIDAEYCPLYSLYFTYLYGKHGFPKNIEGLRAVVNETFISSPMNVKRNPCIATNKFRLVFMSFILTVFTIAFDDKGLLSEVKQVFDNVAKSEFTNNSSITIQKPSYLLLEPSVLAILERKLASPEVSSVEETHGGRRTRKRKAKKNKRSRKH